jgi:hypothetical protein
MVKIFIVFFLLIGLNSFAQCVNLTIKEHFSGDPICNLYSGAILEICYEDKTVTAGSCGTLYIKSVSGVANQTFELALDNVYWAPTYATLQINTNTKRLGFVIGGNMGLYSYYTETEAESYRAVQAERDRIINQNRIEQAKAFDEKTKVEINSALEQKEYFKALQLYSLLNYKDDGLLIKINEGWLPEKERYTKLYQDYTAQFNQVKREYYTSEKDFYIKHAENIKSKKISINGKEAYSKRIASTSDPDTKIYRVDALFYDAYVYSKNNQKHFLCPVGLDGNYYAGRYSENNVSHCAVELLYDTIANTYVPMIGFYKDNQLLDRNPIVNTNDFETNYFLMPLPMEIDALFQKVVNESGRKMLEELFPQQILPLSSSESIAYEGLAKVLYPGEGKKNDKYETLKIQFNTGIKGFEKYLQPQKKIVSDNYYNPSLLYLIKKLYPNADTLVFVFGDYKKSLGNLGLHIDYLEDRNNEFSGARGGSFVPLTKGIIELKNNTFLVYDNSGNYSEVAANLIMRESIFPLTDLAVDKLTLDSIFIYKNCDSRYTISYVCQIPIYYKQLTMNTDNLNPEYALNENLIIQTLPVYLNRNTELPNSSIPIYDPINNFKLNFNSYDSYLYPIDKIAIKYFKEMSNYFNFQNQKNSKNAIKSLTKANQYIESFKKIYFSPKKN